MSNDPISLSDLSLVRNFLITRHRWTPELAAEAESDYKRLMVALRTYDPHTQQIVLTAPVAAFWRTHILNTHAYHHFCTEMFGRYMPYLHTRETEIADAVESLDFTFIKRRLMNPLDGPGWSQLQADAVERRYKRFLFLAATRGPEDQLVAADDIEEFWQRHILDHARYSADCDRIFGGYLHHAPASPERLGEALLHLSQRYETLYGEPYLQPA